VLSLVGSCFTRYYVTAASSVYTRVEGLQLFTQEPPPQGCIFNFFISFLFLFLLLDLKINVKTTCALLPLFV
jgi:hypothetical protein